MFWRGLTTFGRGLITALCGILIKTAGILAKADTVSMGLTTIGIVVFFAGLYRALLGMDNEFKECKKLHLSTREKE